MGFGASLDLDVFDPADAPGVGSPEADGIPTEALLSGLKLLGNQEGFQALELVEYNPELDIDQKMLNLTSAIISSLRSQHVASY